MDQQALQMFARLARGEPAFERWVRAELDKITKTLILAPEESRVRVAQGRAQQLTELVDYLEYGKKHG